MKFLTSRGKSGTSTSRSTWERSSTLCTTRDTRKLLRPYCSRSRRPFWLSANASLLLSAFKNGFRERLGVSLPAKPGKTSFAATQPACSRTSH